MLKLLSTIFLIITVVLFPPAALAVLSNDAVPGQATYPIKRALESGILFVASINPTTKAYFSVNQSERRYKEAATLIEQGQNQNVSESLNELVSQTDEAVIQIDQVQNIERKQTLINNLSVSIAKYDKGLEAASVAIAPSPVTPTFDSGNSVANKPQEPVATPAPKQATTDQNKASGGVVSSAPITPVISPTPIATSVRPSTSPTTTETPKTLQPQLVTKQEIENTRKKLEEIQQKLKQKTEEQKIEKTNEEGSKAPGDAVKSNDNPIFPKQDSSSSSKRQQNP